MMNRTKKLTGFLLFFAFGATMLFAQGNQSKVSDAELEKFAGLYQQMRMMNQNVQLKMAKVITEEEMKIPRFNEIHKAEMDPARKVETTKAEKEKYSSILSKIEKMQLAFQDKMKKQIQEGGLSLERYQEIIAQLQTDKKLQERLKATFN